MNFLHRDNHGIPKNATYRLTQDGREKLHSYNGTPQARILAALETQGTSDRDEIASASGMSRGSVERHTLALLQKGYVQQVGHGSSPSMDMGGGLGDDDDSPRKRRMRG